MSKLDELIRELCPNGVEYKNLKEISVKISDGSHNPPRAAVDGKRFPMISAQNINEGRICLEDVRWISEEDFLKEDKRTSVERGDVLITIVGAIGRTAVVTTDEKMACQRSVCVIKPRKDLVSSQYLRYSLESSELQKIMNSQANGAAQKGIYLRQLEKIMIKVPPVEVQEEVVRILDSYTIHLTALIKQLEDELEARKKQYSYYRDSLLTFDVPRGGTIDFRWRMLCEIADISTGNSNTNEAVEDGKYPFFVRSQELLRKNDYEHDETAIITAGDGVGVGKVYHYIEGKYALHQRAYRIHINTPEVMPKYYFHYMKAKFLPYIRKTMFQGSVASIRRPMLNAFPVPVPPLDVQNRIVNVLDNFEKICSDLTIGLPAEIEARQKQYEYYRDKLLTFAETGNTILSRAEQSRAEQSRAEQSRAEQSTD